MANMMMEHTDKFCTKQILASWNTAWDSEGDFTLVSNETVDAPFAVTSQTIFVDLFLSKTKIKNELAGSVDAQRTLNHFRPVTSDCVASGIWALSTQFRGTDR